MTTQNSGALLSVNDLKKHYAVKFSLLGRPTREVKAVDGITFDIKRGETLSIVGESGCGKSTVGKTIAGLIPPTHGEVILDGERVDTLSAAQFRQRRKRIQVVFQDPFSSLDPRMKVRQILAEPIRNFGLASSKHDMDDRIRRILDMVQLPADAADRFPHEFSGGQRQRIGIGRALAAEPEIIICDEAVSALDVSVKAQVVNLLQELKQRLGLSLLFISHDLAIVDHLTDRVAVMYLGKIVELGDRDDIFGDPKHPYTQALLSAVPTPEVGNKPERIILKGDVPSPANPPSGCAFHTRCPLAFERCRHEAPTLKPVSDRHTASCHLVS